jgi:platelet-activating factor acetylhydrolase
MLFLPSPKGPFSVGATHFRLPVSPPQTYGTAQIRNRSTGKLEPALVLEEMAFTAYYPAEVKGIKKGIDWLQR